MSLFAELQKAMHVRLSDHFSGQSPAVGVFYSQDRGADDMPFVALSEFSRLEDPLKAGWSPWEVQATAHIWSGEASLVEVSRIQDELIAVIGVDELEMPNYLEVMGSRQAIAVEVDEEVLRGGKVAQHGTVKYQWLIQQRTPGG